MITYTRAEKEGKPADYDCGLCPHSAPDVDGARAHQAVHVAGPELLAALKEVERINNDGERDAMEIERVYRAAIAKAEPAPKQVGCPPDCPGCGCGHTPHPPCGHCESHQTPEGA